MLCARVVEDLIELREVMYLSRAGWAPPHLHNGWAKHSSVPDLRFPLILEKVHQRNVGEEESRKINVLADKTSSLLPESRGFGGPEFRCWLSRTIQSAAASAFDEECQSIKLSPFSGNLS